MSDNFEIKNQEIEKSLREIAEYIKNQLPEEGWGFTLFIDEHGDNGARFYISSNTRESVLESLPQFMEMLKS